VERCARLRAVAARVFRMFFFADAILGTERIRAGCEREIDKGRGTHVPEPAKTRPRGGLSQAVTVL
jgi:hypothetical protein